MRLGIVSDMHGNALAFQAVLEELASERVDGLVCLGDAVQGGPQPAEVLRLLRSLGCPVIMGNADSLLLHGIDATEDLSSEETERVEAVRQWSLSQLSEADLAFMRGFQPTVTLALDEQRELLCFHGSPQSFNDFILPLTPDAEVESLFGGTDAAFLCGGHTHLQQVRHLGQRVFFNPGSAGSAYRHKQDADFRLDPWAEYALLDVRGGRLSLDFRRVPFDVEQLAQLYRASDMPFTESALERLGVQ